MNYAASPFCRIYSALDSFLLLVSLVSTAERHDEQSVQPSALSSLFVSQILYRYGVAGYVTQHWGDSTPETTFSIRKDVEVCILGDPTSGPWADDTPSEDVLDEDAPFSDVPYYPALLNEALSLLVNLVTNVPGEPSADPVVRLEPLVRRELVHRLVAGSATYSQLADSVSIFPVIFYSRHLNSSCILFVIVYLCPRNTTACPKCTNT
jgi:hypothetical protein